MKLVNGWQRSWRWLSVQILTVIAAAPLVWMNMPEDAKEYIPEEYRPIIVAVLGAAGVIGRLVDQRKA